MSDDRSKLERLERLITAALDEIRPGAEGADRLSSQKDRGKSDADQRSRNQAQHLDLAVHHGDRRHFSSDRKNRHYVNPIADNWAMFFLMLAVGIFSFRLALALMN